MRNLLVLPNLIAINQLFSQSVTHIEATAANDLLFDATTNATTQRKRNT
jgi:hypothetical protein